NTLCHPLWMKYIEGVHGFSRANKLDWFPHGVFDGQSSSPARVTIQLSQYYPVVVDDIVKGFVRIDCILPCHRIHYKYGFVWLNRLVDVGDLIHHRLIDSQSSGGIDDYYIEIIGFGVFNTFYRDIHRILMVFNCKHMYLNLFTDDLQLIDSCWPVHVPCNQEWGKFLFRLEIFREFPGKGGFTRSLQPSYQNHARLSAEVDPLALTSHQFGEFILDDLDHEVPRAY